MGLDQGMLVGRNPSQPRASEPVAPITQALLPGSARLDTDERNERPSGLSPVVAKMFVAHKRQSPALIGRSDFAGKDASERGSAPVVPRMFAGHKRQSERRRVIAGGCLWATNVLGSVPRDSTRGGVSVGEQHCNSPVFILNSGGRGGLFPRERRCDGKGS